MSLVKSPVQIYLDERQNKALRRLAKEKNTSVSELVRRGIDLLLGQVPAGHDPAYQIIGLGASGVMDIAEKHDEYLVQETQKEGK
ncbi:MAG: ribbon-helix-helix protein, CopG family [Anaerolineales bacterium]|jgi:16S rRNA U516 pseudouridylate synthase RsuA-like enzyme